jgi:pilus assembly protein Flp/PilA
LTETARAGQGVVELKYGLRNFRPAGRLVSRFVRDEHGATAVEYGMIVGLLSVVLIASLGIIGETTRDGIFGAVASALDAVTGGSGG